MNPVGPVRAWVQGQARRSNAREVDAPSSMLGCSPLPILLLCTMLMLGELGAWECMAGPCCGERGNAGDPCAPVLGGEDGREAAARRRRLKS
jgi:hypothetical protein